MRSTFPTYAFDSLSISAVARSVLNSPPRCCGEDQCLKPVARLTKSKVFGFPEPLLPFSRWRELVLAWTRPRAGGGACSLDLDNARRHALVPPSSGGLFSGGQRPLRWRAVIQGPARLPLFVPSHRAACVFDSAFQSPEARARKWVMGVRHTLFPVPTLGASPSRAAAGFPTLFSMASGVNGLVAGPSSALTAARLSSEAFQLASTGGCATGLRTRSRHAHDLSAS
jgi:hypothetical protein